MDSNIELEKELEKGFKYKKIDRMLGYFHQLIYLYTHI
jgi:hypothetical protein